MGSFLSDTFFQAFSSTVNMFISIFMIQILHNITNSWIFSDIGRNCLLGSRKKIAKFLMRTFTCRSTFLYDFVFFLPWLLWSAQYKIFFSSPYTIAIDVSPTPSNQSWQSKRRLISSYRESKLVFATSSSGQSRSWMGRLILSKPV
jgi:hypothetical protein